MKLTLHVLVSLLHLQVMGGNKLGKWQSTFMFGSSPEVTSVLSLSLDAVLAMPKKVHYYNDNDNDNNNNCLLFSFSIRVNNTSVELCKD